MDVKCPCNNCSEHLEFDESAAGETIACPHCGMDTVLFIPKAPVAQPIEPESAPKPETKRASYEWIFALGGAVVFWFLPSWLLHLWTLFLHHCSPSVLERFGDWVWECLFYGLNIVCLYLAWALLYLLARRLRERAIGSFRTSSAFSLGHHAIIMAVAVTAIAVREVVTKYGYVEQFVGNRGVDLM